MNASSEKTNDPGARVASNWAKPVTRIKVEGVPEEAINLNVDGRQVVGALQGFGQLWQKTYKVRLSGSLVTPDEVILTWKANFGSFWPKGNRFYAPLTSIEPGEVAVLNLSGPAGITLSTGVVVIYADEQSFTFMTPQGHMFAGWITFSAFEEDGQTTAQAQVLIRSNDPLWEIIMRLFGFRKEDEFWHATLEALASHFRVQGQVQQINKIIDPRLQWSQAKNIWHNASIRSAFYTMGTPLRWARKKVT